MKFLEMKGDDAYLAMVNFKSIWLPSLLKKWLKDVTIVVFQRDKTEEDMLEAYRKKKKGHEVCETDSIAEFIWVPMAKSDFRMLSSTEVRTLAMEEKYDDLEKFMPRKALDLYIESLKTKEEETERSAEEFQEFKSTKVEMKPRLIQ